MHILPKLQEIYNRIAQTFRAELENWHNAFTSLQDTLSAVLGGE